PLLHREERGVPIEVRLGSTPRRAAAGELFLELGHLGFELDAQSPLALLLGPLALLLGPLVLLLGPLLLLLGPGAILVGALALDALGVGRHERLAARAGRDAKPLVRAGTDDAEPAPELPRVDPIGERRFDLDEAASCPPVHLKREASSS